MTKDEEKNKAAMLAVLAAAFYAVNIPLSKVMMQEAEPAMMAAFLYLGAGLGLILYSSVGRMLGKQVVKEPLTGKELPYTIAMVLLDIAAPILLMYGIFGTGSATVSLLNNFEIAATSLIALLVFGEVISKRLWLAIGLVTAASILLGVDGFSEFAFQKGAMLVLGACVCWGVENNCTRKLSSKSSVEIVMIKGCFSGMGSLCVAYLSGEHLPEIKWIGMILILGFVSYGLSINFYIMAQKELGASKTSAYYSIAPFLGAGFGMLFLKERPGASFYAAGVLMIVSTWLLMKDSVHLQHTHEHTHVHMHEHRHGDMIHTHEHIHTHAHIHTHGEEEEKHGHCHEYLEDHDHTHREETI